MKHFPRVLMAFGFITALTVSLPAGAIPQSDMPSFQYDATEYFADKELKKVREATQLAVKNHWQMRITAPAEWHDKLMQAVTEAAAGKPVKVDFTNTIIESVVINLSKAKKPARKAKKRPAVSKKRAPAALTAPTVSRPKGTKPSRDGVFGSATQAVMMDEVKPHMPDLGKAPAQSSKAGSRQAKPAAQDNAGTENRPETQGETQAETQAKNVTDIQPAKAAQAPTPVAGKPTAETPPSAVADETRTASTAIQAVAPATTGDSQGAEAVSPRQWLQDTYLQGKAVERELSIEKIRNDDQIMVRDGQFLLVRFSHGRRAGWWLKSPVDLTSSALKKIGTDKYRVENKIRLVKDSRTMNRTKEAADAAGSPASVSLEEERKRLEKRYNKGRKIKKTLLPKNIHKDDTIIVGNGLKVLLRSERDGSLRRYWLDGEVNLENTDVFRQDSTHKFTALRKYTPKDAQ